MFPHDRPMRRPTIDPRREEEIRKEISALTKKIGDLRTELQGLEKESPREVLNLFQRLGARAQFPSAHRPAPAHLPRFIDAINFLVEEGQLIAVEVNGEIGWRLSTDAEKAERDEIFRLQGTAFAVGG